MSERAKIEPEKAKFLRERNKERNLILQEIKKRGSATVDELSEATGMEMSKVLKHLIAMRQFGKVSIVDKRENELVYGLPEENG